MEAAEADLLEMRTAIELLQEQRGAPQYSPKEYRALEATLNDTSRQIHRLQAPVNAYLEAAAHRCTMAGALELIVALDTFDFMRVKRRLRARHSQLSVRMMEALHLARPLAKPKERRGLAVAMQARYLVITPRGLAVAM